MRDTFALLGSTQHPHFVYAQTRSVVLRSALHLRVRAQTLRVVFACVRRLAVLWGNMHDLVLNLLLTRHRTLGLATGARIIPDFSRHSCVCLPSASPPTPLLRTHLQACHEMVPPDAVEPLLRQLVNQFVHDKARPEVVAVGIQTVRGGTSDARHLFRVDVFGCMFVESHSHFAVEGG